MANPEQNRLQEAHEEKQPWYRFGPYLSERQWGTVREDYSPMAPHGISSHMIMPVRARTVGAKMD